MEKKTPKIIHYGICKFFFQKEFFLKVFEYGKSKLDLIDKLIDSCRNLIFQQQIQRDKLI